MASKKKKEEEKPEIQATYWVGAKAHIDIVFDGFIYNISFPAYTPESNLEGFMPVAQQVFKDFVAKRNKEQPDKQEKQPK